MVVSFDEDGAISTYDSNRVSLKTVIEAGRNTEISEERKVEIFDELVAQAELNCKDHEKRFKMKPEDYDVFYG